MTSCERAAELAVEMVRGDELPEEVAAHLESCAECAAIRDGAGRLGADLAAWEAPDPADDLIERTLARIALAGPFERDEPDEVEQAAGVATATVEAAGAGDLAPIQRLPPRRRTSVELLTSAVGNDEPTSNEPPSRGRLVARVLFQAAAAVVLFGVSGVFVAAFYPAVAEALESRRVDECAERLSRLSEAAGRYRREWPAGPTLTGHELRKALIEGGYADPADFVCAGRHGEALGPTSFDGELRAGELEPRAPLFWDKFGNHSSGMNVAYADGRVELVTSATFGRYWSQRQAGELDGD